MTRNGVDGDFGAKALAVAHISPIGATRYSGGRAQRAVGARQALNQPTDFADMNLDVSCGTLRSIDGPQCVRATKFANVRH